MVGYNYWIGIKINLIGTMITWMIHRDWFKISILKSWQKIPGVELANEQDNDG